MCLCVCDVYRRGYQLKSRALCVAMLVFDSSPPFSASAREEDRPPVEPLLLGSGRVFRIPTPTICLLALFKPANFCTMLIFCVLQPLVPISAILPLGKIADRAQKGFNAAKGHDSAGERWLNGGRGGYRKQHRGQSFSGDSG